MSKQTLAMYTDNSEVSSTLKVSLTPHNVLQIFDEVLKLDGWPENDWISCNVGDDLEPVGPRLYGIPLPTLPTCRRPNGRL